MSSAETQQKICCEYNRPITDDNNKEERRERNENYVTDNMM